MSILMYFTQSLALTRPDTYHAVLPALDQITLLNPHALDGRENCGVVIDSHAWSTVPVSSISLVVDFDHILASCSDDAAIIKHHAGHSVVVSVGIVYGASSQIPDLQKSVKLLFKS